MDIKKLKDKIQQAKKKLGDKQANIIAKGVNLENWDEKHKKGSCPMGHGDSTPSFVWFPEGYCFKCFSCSETMDIIDYYMRFENCNFIQAAQKLIKLANMRFDFTNTDFKQQYRYPKLETNTNRDKVDAYMAKRKISKETLDKLGVKEDDKGNIVFEYRNIHGQLMTTKYRPARKVPKGQTKTWCQAEADTTPLLFNMDKVDITKPLWISEGEGDTASLIESGITNAVSIPFGAGNDHWIEENWEWLENFSKITLWFDEDEAGYDAIKKVSRRLGEERLFIAHTNFKDKNDAEKGRYNDINEQLFYEGKESVYQSAIEAKRVPITDLKDLADVEDFDIENATFISTGIKGLDKWLNGGFVTGSLNVFTGINSSGKSTAINQIMVAEPLHNGHNCFIFSGELTQPQLKTWIDYSLAGVQFIDGVEKNGYTYYKVRKDAKKQMTDWYRGRVHLYDNEKDKTATSLLRAMEKSAKRYGTKVFIIDNLMKVDLEENEKNKLKKEKDFVNALKDFALKFDCIVHLVAHPRKVEGIRRLTKMDVSGSGDITNLADYVLAIHRFTNAEKEQLKEAGEPPYGNVIDLFKNRVFGEQDRSVPTFFDIPSKRFYTNIEEQYRVYSWCENPPQIPEQAFIDFNNMIESATPYDDED